jgi:hypothetical protein
VLAAAFSVNNKVAISSSGLVESLVEPLVKSLVEKYIGQSF